MKKQLDLGDITKLRTFTGKDIDVESRIWFKDICIEDIAHALSMQPRFGGHLKEFYSVAQHSFKCYQLVSKQHKLAALLHDASEAYLIDIPSPVKRLIPGYKEIEDRVMKSIAEKYGFAWPLSEEVKQADKDVLDWEWHSLMIGSKKYTPILCLSPKDAERKFLDAFSSAIHQHQSVKDPLLGQQCFITQPAHT